MNSTNNAQYVADLIEKITPLNNKYRDFIDNSVRGTDVLEVMWNVGNILEDYLKDNNIKPHTLYWQMYGRAEGLKNSYITRDFLSYCLRIRRYFGRKEEIRDNLPDLKLYSLFREALPLLENPKYQLPEGDKKKLIKLLNSKLSVSEIKSRIVAIKREKIGINNSRNQKLAEMKLFTDSFVLFYNEVYSLIKEADLNRIQRLRSKMPKGYINDLSQLISALTQEDLFVPKVEMNSELPDNWQDFIMKINLLFAGNIDKRNRFRRLVSPKKLMQLSDMVLALADDKKITNYKIKFL